jgi:multidrug efflux pump subunit AcrA (membrane-fusion protein)
MTEHTGRPWLNYLLGLLCVGAILAAVLVVGPASGSQTVATRTARASLGVVQATVSGSGNLQPASQLNLGFKTGGTVTHIYVTQGEHVTEGRLLAELDPSSAEVTLEQARANLQAAQAKLAQEEETGGEPSKSQSSSTPAATSAVATSSSTQSPTNATPEHAGEGSTREGSKNASEGESKQDAGTGNQAKPGTQSSKSGSSTPSPSNSNSSTPSSSNSGSSGSTTSSSSSTSTLSAATREANLASARAAVKSDELTVKTDEEAVADTKLLAPQDGTIVTLSGQVGEVVSASGTTKASGDSGSSDSSGSGSSGSGGSATGGSSSSARSGGASSSASTGSSGSSGSSSTAFAVLSDLSSMHLVVALSESEIGNVKVGQIATVTVEALSGRKLAAHVSEVANLSTSSSGVVSYDVTFQLDQMTDGLKPGMSATAEVVVKQAEGVNVPTSAISAGSVTVVRGGKNVRQPVVTGLAGNTSTIILSGIKAGETVVLPAAVSTSSATSLTSRLSRLAGGGGGLAGGGLGGGGGAFFRGGGGG